MSKHTYIILGLIAGLFLAMAEPADAQWPAEVPPASSAYWWTLKPELKPQELRRLLLDRGRHRQAFVEAAARDPKLQDLANSHFDDLVHYVDGAVTPELIRMPLAFDDMLIVYVYDTELERLAADLESHIQSRSDLELLLDHVAEARKQRPIVVAEEGEVALRFAKLMHDYSLANGNVKTRDVLKKRDLQELARFGGFKLHEVRDWADAWVKDGVEELAQITLAEIKASVSEESWNGFRKFLLEQIAPESVVVKFDEWHSDEF